MPGMGKKLLIVALIAGAGYGAWRWHDGGAARPAADAGLAFDRLWIDHVPRDDKDTIHAFVALTEQPVGVFQSASVWRGSYEVYLYEARDGELRVVFPQTGDRERIRVRAQACHEHDMDYCLEIKGASRGVKRYYSRKGWEIDAHDAAGLTARTDQLVHALAPRTP